MSNIWLSSGCSFAATREEGGIGIMLRVSVRTALRAFLEGVPINGEYSSEPYIADQTDQTLPLNTSFYNVESKETVKLTRSRLNKRRSQITGNVRSINQSINQSINFI